MIRWFTRAVLLLAVLAFAGCNETLEDIAPKAERQLPESIVTAMKAKGMRKGSPIMVRIFKEEGVLEIWKAKYNGRYDKIASYDICKWSGELGPKFTEGDRQAPEGFYTVRPAQMNPKSSYHLAFNIGYPNTYDRANGRTGKHLMVHGACSSAGCYSMTDEQVEEIYAFARDAFRGGQREFQVQAYPFRMTAENMARYRGDPNYPFWKMLKEGYDHFEVTRKPPKVDVCEKRYVFNRAPVEGESFSATEACPRTTQPPALTLAYQKYQTEYEAAFAAALEERRKAEQAPTIAGREEALLVADWSKRRARGEKVSRQPPSIGPTAVAGAEEPAASTPPVAATASAYTSETTPSSMDAALQAAAAPEASGADAAAAPVTTGSIPLPESNPRRSGERDAAATQPAPRSESAATPLGQRIRNLFGG